MKGEELEKEKDENEFVQNMFSLERQRRRNRIVWHLEKWKKWEIMSENLNNISRESLNIL